MRKTLCGMDVGAAGERSYVKNKKKTKINNQCTEITMQ